jgi:hypothetical protein
MAKIYEDTRQQVHDGDKHAAKHEWWAAHGVEVERKKLDFGDYMADGSNRSVDTKRDVYELMGNLGSGYRRIDHECSNARDAGYRLVFLCEAGEQFADPSILSGIRSRFCMKCAYGFRNKCNPCDPKSGCQKRGDRKKPFQGYSMAGKMAALEKKHGAVFAFCDPCDAAKAICDLLGVDYE